MSSYVEPEDTREEVDIVALNAEIAQIVARQERLRASIDQIVAELEADEAGAAPTQTSPVGSDASGATGVGAGDGAAEEER